MLDAARVAGAEIWRGSIVRGSPRGTSFDDVHPFVTTRFIVNGGESARQEMRRIVQHNFM